MLKIWAILAVLVLVFPLVACEERKGCGNLTYQNYTQMFCTHNIVFWGHGVDAVSAIQLNEWPVKEHTEHRWKFRVRRWFRYYNARGSNLRFVEVYQLDRHKSCEHRDEGVDISNGFLVYAKTFAGSMLAEQDACEGTLYLWDCLPEKLKEKLLNFNHPPILWKVEHLRRTCRIINAQPPPKHHRQAVKLPDVHP